MTMAVMSGRKCSAKARNVHYVLFYAQNSRLRENEDTRAARRSKPYNLLQRGRKSSRSEERMRVEGWLVIVGERVIDRASMRARVSRALRVKRKRQRFK
jgi:hypothetical protein